MAERHQQAETTVNRLEIFNPLGTKLKRLEDINEQILSQLNVDEMKHEIEESEIDNFISSRVNEAY